MELLKSAGLYGTDVADAVNEPFEKIYDKAISFYKENRKGDLEIMQLLTSLLGLFEI